MGQQNAPSRGWRSLKEVLSSPGEEASQSHRLAERALAHGDLDAAIEHYNRAMAAAEEEPASPLAASTLIRRGGLYLLRNHPDLALEDYDQVIDLLHSELDRFRMSLEIARPDGHHRLTQLLRRTRVRDLRLMLAMVYHNRTIAWQTNGDHDKARTAALKAIEYSPEYVVRLYHQGQMAPDQAGRAGQPGHNRRLFNRVQARLKANYGLGHANPLAPQALRGATEDISAAGVKLRLTGQHEVENRAAAQVRLVSELSEGRVILPAKVNWVAPDQAAPQTVVGVQLLGVDLTQWDEWLKILTRHAVKPGPDEV